MDIIVPNVNINGTSHSELVEQVRNVREALRSAREAMAKATPHGRDYYDSKDSIKARVEHKERAKILHEMEEAYLQLEIAIFDQRR